MHITFIYSEKKQLSLFFSATIALFLSHTTIEILEIMKYAFCNVKENHNGLSGALAHYKMDYWQDSQYLWFPQFAMLTDGPV